MRERESVLERLEERMSRLSGWVAERRRGGRLGTNDLQARLEAVRNLLAHARRSVDAGAREDLRRARDTLADLRNDYDVPPPHFAFRGTEPEALRRHLQTTARLARVLLSPDDPSWDQAHEEYERSWAEVQRAFEPEGDAASP